MPDNNRDSTYEVPINRMQCGWCGGWFAEATFDTHPCIDDARMMPPAPPRETPKK